jgi:hypothetical protein
MILGRPPSARALACSLLASMSCSENAVHSPRLMHTLYIPSENAAIGVWMGSGKKCANAKVSEASPLVTDPSPVAADTSDGLIRKKRR